MKDAPITDVDDPEALIATCYLALLQIPHASPLRTRNQNVMARCRDYLAERAGVEPEDVQNRFERHAWEYASKMRDV